MTFWIITILVLACVLAAVWLSDRRRRRRGGDVKVSDSEVLNGKIDARANVAKIMGPKVYRR